MIFFQEVFSKSAGDWKYASEILLKVSRTFALNINVLRGDLRRAVLLAYLYLRIADTIEDAFDMEASQKAHSLALFAEIFKNYSNDKAFILSKTEAFLSSLPNHWRNSEKKDIELSLSATRVVTLLSELPETLVRPVCEVVLEMCAGMAKFVLKKEESTQSGWFTLESLSDLDEYCYYVAGIVGRLLSKVFYAETSRLGKEAFEQMQTLDVSFGSALQLTNIIKDVREDSERKVCFVPEALCREFGFENSPALFSFSADKDARANVLSSLVQKAWKHVEDGVRYTLLIPRHCMRVRLFCLWPLLMAAENLCALGDCRKIFESDEKIKISRSDVKRIVKSSSLHFYSNSWIEKTFESYRQFFSH